MSLLRFCKRKPEDGGEPPGPKRSRTETVADVDGVPSSIEGDGTATETVADGDGVPSSIEGDVTARVETAGISSRDKKKQASKFSKEWLKGREHWLSYFPEKGMFCSL